MNKKYIVLFSSDFKCKVDSFNLYITDNYVKRTIGRCIPPVENIKNLGSLTVSLLLFHNLITDRTFVNQNQIN